MILDNLKNSKLYFPLGEGIQKGLKYLTSTDFSNLEPGRYEIDGDKVYAMVQTYNTKPASAGRWEAHKKYIDIQFIAVGKEKIGYTSFEKVINLEEYDEEKDYGIYKGDGNYLIAEEGQFAVFFPTDVHMPSIAINIPKEVKKVVVKVLVENYEEKNEQEMVVI